MAVLAKTIAETRERLAAARAAGATVGLVPTLGALHAGHVSLIRAAREETDFVAVSVFVNPPQFSDRSDLEAYPRTLDADLDVCRRERVDLVFAPSAAEMYPDAFGTTVRVGGMGEKMCGAFRPGHFDAVCTVVAELFGIVRPDVAYFGEKDAQQLAIVRRMTADLNLPVRIRACPTVRDPDGLALSSRNARLSADERRHALALGRALVEARKRIEAGDRDARALAEAVRDRLEAAEGLDLEYVSAVDPDTLEDVDRIRDRILMAVAARVGPARLIDNIVLRNLEAE